MSKYFITFFLALCVCGCNFGKMYVQPTEGKLADLTFSTTDRSSQVVDVVRYTGTEFMEHKGEIIAWLSKSESNYSGESVTVKAKANEEFRFTYRNSYTTIEVKSSTVNVDNYFCISHVSFIPRENVKYFITNGVENASCWVKIVYESNGVFVPEPSVKHLKSCIDPNLAGSLFPNNVCTKDFKF